MSGTILGFPFSGVVVGNNGSIAAEPGDGSIANGNARGENAVDWQQLRVSAVQVASGAHSVIGGGFQNSASGAAATIAGGDRQIASATRATVSGGGANSATGFESTVCGGVGNTASGHQAAVAGGSGNLANGAQSWVPGGNSGTTRGVVGRGAWAAGRITTIGDAQCGEHSLMRQTVDATATRLTANNAAAGTTNTINLPNFAAYSGTLTVVAKATGSNAAATWRVNVSAVRGNGVATTALYEGAGTAIAPTASSDTGSAWRLDIAADTVNGGIAVSGTGAAATTINWSARFANVEATTAS